MTPASLKRWSMSAWDVAGIAAPAVLGRYAILTALNRTSRRRIIRSVPALLTSSTTSHPAPDAPPPKGDVVVPVYNNFEDTSALLDVLATDRTYDGRVILVHDASSDARMGPLLKAFAANNSRAVLLENPVNSGFVKTCNRGIAASERDVVILNTDITIPHGAIARLLRRLQSDADIATVTPFSNAAYCVGLPDLLFDNRLPFGSNASAIDQALQALPCMQEIVLPSGIGFCLAMSRASLNGTGLFDEHFGQGYGEETDFCLRAASAGLRNVLASDVFVGHKGGQSFGQSWQDMARRGSIKVIHRHPGFPARVGHYLAHAPTRALSFAALVRLVETTSGVRVHKSEERKDASDAPALHITPNWRAWRASLSWRDESHEFLFAQRVMIDACLALARATP